MVFGGNEVGLCITKIRIGFAVGLRFLGVLDAVFFSACAGSTVPSSGLGFGGSLGEQLSIFRMS